jgi:hypothetical protein
MILIHNIETGEIIEREMNAEELAQFAADQAAAQAAASAAADAAAEKVALLEKLGISANEAKLLIG